MADSMMFPREWEKFIEDYSFTDSEEVYTNGSELVPVFRVEQMVEHYFDNTSIHVADTPAVPGPSEDDHNIMELCFHNGERHMKEKMLAKLAQLMEGLDYHKAVFICKCLEDI